jgi:hypothetical protein
MSNLRTVALTALILSAVLCAFPASAQAADAPGVKQAVFLLCPHTSKYSAWSLYLMVDPADPKKILSLGLEKLKQQNSKDSSYDAVVAASKDSKTPRELVASMDAKDFGSRQLRVEKDDALHVGISPEKDGTYLLSVSMRVSADERFSIGDNGKNRTKVLLTYDAGSKNWEAKAKDVFDNKGAKVDAVSNSHMTGILFPVSGTGIEVVAGMFDNSDGVTMMDRSEISKRGD